MVTITWVLIILILGAYLAWQYSKTEADADFAMFNLAAFTGSWYGRDFADCKSPLVHLYFWAIAKAAAADVKRVKFAHHFLVGGVTGVLFGLITGNYSGGLAFTMLVNAGRLNAFTGNVGQVPAALIVIGLVVPDPWLACSLFILAALYEPKLIVATIPVICFKSWWIPAMIWLIFGVCLAAGLYYLKHSWWDWLVEANILIPARMNKMRKSLYPWMPSYTSESFTHMLPWIIMAVSQKPELSYWIPPAAFFALSCFGHVIRPHHWLPIIPWIACAVSPMWAVILVIADLAASGFYIGDNWARFYPGFIESIRDVKTAGEYVKDKPGSLWSYGMHTEVNLYARKPVLYGLAEQIEINVAVPGRRERMIEEFKKNPPDWVVESPCPNGVQFDPRGYKLMAKGNFVRVWQRVGG